ncbi:MAG: hypothetical protein WBV94_11000 [Blastocatellia bacterium]
MAAKPIGEEFMNVSTPLSDIAAKSDVYLAGTAADDNRLFFTPFFAFKADQDRKLKAIRQNPPPGQQSHSVLLTILVSPQTKVEAMAAFIRSQHQLATPPGRFSNLQSSSLIAIPMLNLRIEEIADGPIFKAVTLLEETLEDEITLQTIGFSKEVADELAGDLREGRFIPRFKVTYELNAVFTDSVSTAEVRVANAATTEAVQQLLGNGKAFNFDINITGGALDTGATIITRDQKTSFEGDVKEQVRIAYTVQNSEDLKILEASMNRYLNSSLSPFSISLTEVFANDIAKLSDFGFQKSDLQPDQINRLVSSVKQAYQQEDKKLIDTSFAAKADFLGLFSAGADGNFKLDELKKSMEEKGWQFELEGNVTVPKSFQVFVVDKKALRRESNFAVSVRRETLQNNRLTAEVSTTDTLPRVTGNLDVPLGTILDWLRPDANIAVPFGFQLCDGAVIADPESPLFQRRTPNLIDRFTMGVTGNRLGESGGRPDIPIGGDHTHNGRTATPRNSNASDPHGFDTDEAPGRPPEVTGIDHTHTFSTSNNGSHSHGGDNRPPFIGVLKIMRIK